MLLISEGDKTQAPPALQASPDALFIPKGKLSFKVQAVPLPTVSDITTQRLKVDVSDLLERPDVQAQSAVAQQLLRLAQGSPQGLPTLDPVQDLRAADVATVEAWTRCLSLHSFLAECQCAQCPQFAAHHAQLLRRRDLDKKIADLRFQLSDARLQLLPEYEQRLAVLRRLRYIDDDGAVQLKGRVACELNTCHEVVVTELLFENALTHLQPEEIVALLSCFTFQEKATVEPTLTKTLSDGVEVIKRIASQVAEVQLECGLRVPVDVFLDAELRFGLVEVVWEWARGTPFCDITALTDVLEGSIVRCIVRLEEACRDVRNAARVVGDPVLYEKMEKASALIKRDIVFAASLYTS